MIKPTVSIITANYNSSDNLFKLYLNLLKQDVLDFEWIIVDSKSSDGSTEFLKTVINFPYKIISEKDSGIYDAFNKGVSLASGELIYFLGADDRLASVNTLSSVIKMYKESPASDIYYGSIVSDNSTRSVFKSNLNYRILFINTVHGQSAFYRKKIFDSFNFNTAEKIIADYELNLYLYLINAKKQILPFTVAICGANGVSNNSNEYINYKGMNNIRKKYINRIISNAYYIVGLVNLFIKSFKTKKFL